VKSNNGLQPLVELIKDHSNHENKELMAAVTGIKLLKGKTDSNNEILYIRLYLSIIKFYIFDYIYLSSNSIYSIISIYPQILYIQLYLSIIKFYIFDYIYLSSNSIYSIISIYHQILYIQLYLSIIKFCIFNYIYLSI